MDRASRGARPGGLVDVHLVTEDLSCEAGSRFQAGMSRRRVADAMVAKSRTAVRPVSVTSRLLGMRSSGPSRGRRPGRGGRVLPSGGHGRIGVRWARRCGAGPRSRLGHAIGGWQRDAAIGAGPSLRFGLPQGGDELRMCEPGARVRRAPSTGAFRRRSTGALPTPTGSPRRECPLRPRSGS